MALSPSKPAERPPADRSSADVAALLETAAQGSEGAWRELVGLYWRRVFALARARLGDAERAEEITQSVFVSLAETLGGNRYDERGRFESWLFRITMNRVRDEVRRARRQATPSDPTQLTALAPSIDPSREDGRVADPDELSELRSALERLPEADREIIALRHHAGLAFGEIVAVLGEPMGTLLARHHRALRKLRAMLERPAEGRCEGKTPAVEKAAKKEDSQQRKAAG